MRAGIKSSGCCAIPMPQIADATELLLKKMLASRVMLKIHTEKDLENLKVLEKQAVEKHTPIYTQQQ